MSGFLPANSKKFKWKDPSGKYLTDFIQYPDTPKDGKFSKISQIRVRDTDWEVNKSFTCEVEGAADKKAVVTKPALPLPTLTVQPQSPVFTGETVTLTCVMKSFSGWTYKWYKGSSSIPVSEGNTFTIRGAAESHKGQYWCQGERTGRPSTSQPSGKTTLDVQALPLATLTVDPQSPVFTGETVTLTCAIKSFSGWTYKWYKGSSRTPVSEGNTFNITGAAESHKGQYWCQGERSDRPSTSQPSGKTTLDVKALPLPTLTVDPQSPVFTGETVTLTCVIKSFSGWTYKWYKGSSRIPGSGGNTFTIRGAAESHKGQYWCQGERTGRPSTSQPSGKTTLDVTAPPRSPTVSVLPVFTFESQNALCVIENFFPKSLTVTWKEDNAVIKSETPQFIQEDSSGYYTAQSFLKLNKTTQGNKQVFTCEVSHNGKNITTEKRLEGQLSVELTPPSSRDIFLNDTAVLKCIITGRDTGAVNDAVVTWKVPGKDQNSRAKVEKDQLGNGQSRKISKLEVDLNDWFSGQEFECLVSDKHNGEVQGSSQKIKLKKGGVDPEVLIYTLPEARDPNHESVVCEVRGSGDVYIMWQVDGGSYLEGKTGVVEQQDGNESHVSILTVNSQSPVLRKLTCAVKYGGMESYTSPKLVEYSKSKYQECPVCDDK